MTTAVVIGGGSGIGAAVVARQRALGIDVVTWDVTATADIACDITRPDEVDAAAAATVARVGVPDLVTVTAGIGHAGRLLDVPADDWDRVVGTNARACGWPCARWPRRCSRATAAPSWSRAA